MRSDLGCVSALQIGGQGDNIFKKIIIRQPAEKVASCKVQFVGERQAGLRCFKRNVAKPCKIAAGAAQAKGKQPVALRGFKRGGHIGAAAAGANANQHVYVGAGAAQRSY